MLVNLHVKFFHKWNAVTKVLYLCYLSVKTISVYMSWVLKLYPKTAWLTDHRCIETVENEMGRKQSIRSKLCP